MHCRAQRSNTPTQALVLLNDPIYVEAARVFAEHIVRQATLPPTSGMQWAFRHAIARPATEDELQVLVGLLEKHRQYYVGERRQGAQADGRGRVAACRRTSTRPNWRRGRRSRGRFLNLHETISRY